MTESALPRHFAGGHFRIGHVLSRTAAIFASNFLAYSMVTAVAALPPLLVGALVAASPVAVANPLQNAGAEAATVFLTVALEILGQAIVLYGAFQNMRGKPVRLSDCITVGLRRFFPLIRLALCLGLALLAYFLFLGLAVVGLQIRQQPALVTLAVMLWLIPLSVLYVIWFAATPACVVEQLGAFRSLGRSRELTKGHRFRIFGLVLVILIPTLTIAARQHGRPGASGH
jgi:hypothetical protein